ncbi:MAG: agmatine deiminase family protein [Deltaproteobacteria bacterium]|nr:agmatine deiminase family protein [Deltaproteobacteria bacterium]
MPAEWEPHRATWLAWPHNLETWPDQLESVKQIWPQMIRAISPAEEVCLVVNDEREQEEIIARIRDGGAAMEHVSVYKIPTVDVWIRDYGPTFITRRGEEDRLAFNDWIFNAWGCKYESYTQDDSVAKQIAGLLRVPVFDQGVVLEGGSIDVNGKGSCLTTEQCLLNPNRNPHLGRSGTQKVLREGLGVDHFIWLGEGIVGDDTDGHIDDIARFVSPTTIVCALEENPKDENYVLLRENYDRLLAARDQDGKKLDIVPLPMPGPVVYEGARLPASYANFYIANGVVLVPTYNHPNDRSALGILREIFPERKVIGILCAPLVAGLGAIHCVTQQEPAT